MSKKPENTNNNSREGKRAQQVYQYAKKRSEEIQRGLNRQFSAAESKKQ